MRASVTVTNAGPRVAVIGGGFAGLAAAYRLAKAGASVSVFERSGHLGGLAMAFPFRGTEIEKYYHHWFTSDVDVLDLIDELGIGDRVRWISPVMGMFCRGRVWRFTSPLDLLRFRPFSLAAKIRFGVVTLFLQRYPNVETFEGVTAHDWLRRYAGREVYDTVWGPLLRAKFGRHAESISMAWIWNKMRLRGTSRTRGGNKESLGYIDGGFGIVAEAVAAAIERLGGRIHRTERVVGVQPLPAGAGGRFEVRTARRSERFAAVVSTVAPPLLPGLVAGLPSDYRRQCESIEHSAILCTILVVKKSFSPIYWMNVSDRTIPFGGLIEHTNFISPEVYGGSRIAYLSHYTYPDDPVYGMDSDELFEHYRPGLQQIQPEFREDWVEARHMFRDRWAQPIVTADYHRRILPLEAPLRGLFVATMSQVYPQDRGTNYAVRIGNVAAQRVLDSGVLAEDVPGRVAAAARF